MENVLELQRRIQLQYNLIQTDEQWLRKNQEKFGFKKKEIQESRVLAARILNHLKQEQRVAFQTREELQNGLQKFGSTKNQ